MIDVAYKGAVEKNDSKLVITETNKNTGKVNQASIGNLFIPVFCKLIQLMLRTIRRNQTLSTTLNLGYDVRVGMSDLSLITGSTDKCIVIHCAHTDFSSSPPVTEWDSVHLPRLHTTAIDCKTHQILDMSITPLTIPDETPTMPFLRSQKTRCSPPLDISLVKKQRSSQ